MEADISILPKPGHFYFALTRVERFVPVSLGCCVGSVYQALDAHRDKVSGLHTETNFHRTFLT